MVWLYMLQMRSDEFEVIGASNYRFFPEDRREPDGGTAWPVGEFGEMIAVARP